MENEMREPSILRVCFSFSSILLIEDLGLLIELSPKIGSNSRRVVLYMKYHSPFHQRGLFDAPNQSETTHCPLTFFISIWLPLSCRKLEACRYCSLTDRRGGGGYLKINALVLVIHTPITLNQHGDEEKACVHRPCGCGLCVNELLQIVVPHSCKPVCWRSLGSLKRTAQHYYVVSS